MDIESYLNQDVAWEKFKEVDDTYNIEEYNKSKVIKVRIEGGFKYVRTADGATTFSVTSYWTILDVKVRDRINGQEVINVNPIYDFDGSFIYNEAFV